MCVNTVRFKTGSHGAAPLCFSKCSLNPPLKATHTHCAELRQQPRKVKSNSDLPLGGLGGGGGGGGGAYFHYHNPCNPPRVMPSAKRRKRVSFRGKPRLKLANNTNPIQCGGNRTPQPSNFHVKHHPRGSSVCDREWSPESRLRCAASSYLRTEHLGQRVPLPAGGPGSSRAGAGSDYHWPRCPCK